MVFTLTNHSPITLVNYVRLLVIVKNSTTSNILKWGKIDCLWNNGDLTINLNDLITSKSIEANLTEEKRRKWVLFSFFLLLILFRFKQNTFYFMRLSPISTVSIMYSCMNVTDFISNTLVRVYYDISSKRLQDLLPLNFIITMKKYDTWYTRPKYKFIIHQPWHKDNSHH